METKNKERYLESLRRSLSFTGFFYVNPIGRSGGLALWWKDNITLSIVTGNKNIILVDGICVAHSVSWRACFIYGPHDRRARNFLWQQISHLALSASCPFLVIGDFNLIGDVADKHGGSSNTSSRIEEFQSLLSSSELFEIPFKGLNYTWDNNRAENANIRERIDRALANEALLLTFPSQTLTHLPIIGSDHAPLLYNTWPSQKKRRKGFRFESMWTLEASCEHTICNAWTDTSSSNLIASLERNPAHCAKDLTSWSRKHFRNNRKVIEELTNELRLIQSASPTAANNARQRHLRKKLEETWHKEEMFWHQRSRVNWIKFGDQNTRFFHLSTIHRSQRNAITMLKNDSGIVARNSTGSLLACFGNKWRCESALAAELLAIRSACVFAASKGWFNAIIESDSQSAIKLATSENVPPWTLSALIMDIRYWISDMKLDLVWTSRRCNGVAHHVAKIAFSSPVSFMWESYFPVEITSIARSDLA